MATRRTASPYAKTITVWSVRCPICGLEFDGYVSEAAAALRLSEHAGTDSRHAGVPTTIEPKPLTP